MPLLAALLLTICLLTPAHGAAPAQGAVDPLVPHYDISGRIDRKTGGLSADVTISLPASEAQGEVVFILGERFKLQRTQAQPAASVRVEPTDKPLEHLQKIVFTFDRPPERPVELRFRYRGPLNDERLPSPKAYSADVLELALESMWLPFPSVLSKTYTVDLDLRGIPQDLTVVAQGEVSHQGDRVRVHRSMPDIDVPLVAARGLKRVSEPGIEMYARNFDAPIVSVRRQHALGSAEYLQRWLGPLPRGPVRLAVVRHNAPRSSYARAGYIVISDASETEIPADMTIDDVAPNLARGVAHEFAHAWWWLADPMTEHYWLAESMAEYSALRYIEHAFGREQLDKALERKRPLVKTAGPILGHGRPTGDQMYGKGCVLLFELDERIGRSTMDRFMAMLARERPRTTEELLKALRGIAGEAAARELEARLREG